MVSKVNIYLLLACLLFGCQFIVAEKEPVDVESVEPDVPSVVSKKLYPREDSSLIHFFLICSKEISLRMTKQLQSLRLEMWDLFMPLWHLCRSSLSLNWETKPSSSLPSWLCGILGSLCLQEQSVLWLS
jgi:hypothetical protein